MRLPRVSLIAVRTLSARRRVVRGSMFTSLQKTTASLRLALTPTRTTCSRHDADVDGETRRRGAYESFMGVRNGTWKAGIQVLGLKEGGVGWALMSTTHRRLADMGQGGSTQADIIAGKINVHDQGDNKCPH